jgi:hypothetical protein
MFGNTSKTQEQFERAERAYGQAVALIRSLDETFQSAAFRNNPEERYDTRVTLYQFDVILQAILLHTALVDGSFHRLERRLIDRITHYGDLMAYLYQDSAGTLKLSWDRLERLPAQVKDDLLERLPRILDRTCTSFVRPLAIVDSTVDSVDFLGQLEQYLGEIAQSLSLVDGHSEDAEQAAYAEMSEHLLLARWRAIKEALADPVESE